MNKWLMAFKKEIEQTLEQTKTLSEVLQQYRHTETLPVSFFNSSYNAIKALANSIQQMEVEQLKRMQEQLKISRDTLDEINKIVENQVIEEIPVSEIIEEKVAEIIITEEVEIQPVIKSVITEPVAVVVEPTTPTITQKSKDVMILADMQKHMTLNDKFRFQREIFKGSSEEFHHTMDILNRFETLDATWAYIENQPWNTEDEIVSEFKEFIVNRFA